MDANNNADKQVDKNILNRESY